MNLQKNDIKMIVVPVKKTYEINFMNLLPTHLTLSTTSKQDDCLQSRRLFNWLRNEALFKAIHTEKLKEYYDQLCAIDEKPPLFKNNFCLPFKWDNAFKQGFFSVRTSLG